MKDIFEELNSLYEAVETIPLDETHPYYKQLIELKNRGYSIMTAFADEDQYNLDWFCATLPFDTKYKTLNHGYVDISLKSWFNQSKKVEISVCFGTEGTDDSVSEEQAYEYLNHWKTLIEKAHKDKIEIFGE